MSSLIPPLLFAAGVWLLLSRDWLRTVIGISLLGHAVNLILLSSAGSEPNDPLPQALVLTAIVIGFGLQAFLLILGMLYFRRHGMADTDELEEDPR